MSKRASTEDVVEELLNNIFGDNPSHRGVAEELVLKYNDARGSLTRVLRYLEYYKKEGSL